MEMQNGIQLDRSGLDDFLGHLRVRDLRSFELSFTPKERRDAAFFGAALLLLAGLTLLGLAYWSIG